MIANRSGFEYGSGRSRTALTTLKIAVLAPIPTAIVTMAVNRKPGDLRSDRAAKAKSFTRLEYRYASELPNPPAVAVLAYKSINSEYSIPPIAKSA